MTAHPPAGVEFVIPWTPDSRCRPNAKCSERTRIRYRKMGAEAAGYPMKLAYQAIDDESGLDWGPMFLDPVVLDIEIHWEKGRQIWDSDAVVTAFKYVRDALETYQIVGNDRDVRIGEITQVRATEQPQTILRIRSAS